MLGQARRRVMFDPLHCISKFRASKNRQGTVAIMSCEIDWTKA